MSFNRTISPTIESSPAGVGFGDMPRAYTNPRRVDQWASRQARPFTSKTSCAGAGRGVTSSGRGPRDNSHVVGNCTGNNPVMMRSV